MAVEESQSVHITSLNRSAIVFAALIVMGVSNVFAQPVPTRMPGSTHIFPAGGRRGTSVEVRVGAECIPPGTNFYLTGAGLSAPDLLGAKLPLRGEPSPRRLPTEIPICYPKEWQSRVETAADLQLTSRLGCQCIVKGDVVVEIPSWNRNYISEGGVSTLSR